MSSSQVPMIHVKTVDGRTVIEVQDKHIVISEIKPHIETILQTNSDVEEVRILADLSLTIDADLCREIWHGRNLVVLANKIIVCSTVSWNVSGKDSDHIYTSDAGTDENGIGKRGNDGYPGESGGNVLLQADEILHPERLTIISNGGNGSNGQDGGNGSAGADGKGISKADFAAMFPTASLASLSNRGAPFNKILSNIKRLAKEIKTQWAVNSPYNTDTYDTENVLNSDIYQVVDMYVQVVTHDGCEITFSFYQSIFILRTFSLKSESFLLYKGSPGQSGKAGGEFGLGGQAGFPGEITIKRFGGGGTFNIQVCRKMGNDGANGKGGLYGAHGKNGWDMGYKDKASYDRKILYGQDEKSKLQLIYYGQEASDRIYCRYKAHESNYKSNHVSIESSRIDQQSQNAIVERKNTRTSSERQHHSKAVGKKSIPQSRILAAYSERLQLTIQPEDVEYDVLQHAVDNRCNDVEHITDVEIKRQVNFSLDTTERDQFEFARLETSKSQTHVLITNQMNHWNHGLVSKLMTFVILFALIASILQKQYLSEILMTYFLPCFFSSFSLSHLLWLVLLFALYYFYPASSDVFAIKATAKKFHMKHKFVNLNKTAQHLLPYDSRVRRFKLTAESVTRYLEDTAKKNDTIVHPVLGTLQQYIFENTPTHRANIISFVAKVPKSSNTAIKRAIESFILEAGRLKTNQEQINKFYNEFNAYLENQTKNIQKAEESLATELKQPQHEDVLILWNECVHGDASFEDLEKMIRQDEMLRTLYDKLATEENAKYDWEKCCADKTVQTLFKTHLEKEGFMSGSCRVLLAYLYDVNIRVYTEDDDGEMALIEDYNPKSSTVTHILLKLNDFVQLNLNEGYRCLEEERLHKDRIYGRILMEISGLKNIREIDDYLSQKPYYRNDFGDEHLGVEQESKELDEEVLIEDISAFFSGEEKEQVSQRLKIISPKCIDQYGIFESILERFTYEGRHVSFNEFCFLINAVLAHRLDDRQERYTFAWIISAFNQCNWTDELILLQLESSFKQQLPEKLTWRSYLSNIRNKGILVVFAEQFRRNPCEAECVEKILHLLSKVPLESVCSEQLELSEWPYMLKEFYWKWKLESLMPWRNDMDSLTSACFYVLSIENTFGDHLVDGLFESLNTKCKELTQTRFMEILSHFHTQKWILCDDDLEKLKQLNLRRWIVHMENRHKRNSEELNVVQLVSLIKSNANTSRHIVDRLPHIQCLVETINQNKLMFNFNKTDIENWAQSYNRNTRTNTKQATEMYEEMFAVVDRAIELTKNFRLRDTQRLTVLALLTNDSSTLAQVSTGEGKSLIVVATAIIKGLLGEKVDIITSSSVLAKRDAAEYKNIYELFGLNVSHNCSELIQERKDAYSCNQVIYGDLANFQRDYLLDRFYGKHVLGDRNFQNVIVDEVDSMLLDKGNNMLYLSHDIAGMDKLESVYVFIWHMVNRPTDLPAREQVEAIKQAVLSDLYATIRQEDIQGMDKELDTSNVQVLWERLKMSGIIDSTGRLLTTCVDSDKLDKLLSPNFTQYKDRLSFLLMSRIERETYIKIPNFLKTFVERHLNGWIMSAITAMYMQPGQYYVVDVDRSGASADRHANVIILDKDTGTDQVSSQWDEALHQFLQLKHGCKLSNQSLKAVFISNVTFLKMYNLLYGLTGTLGSQRERHLLEEIHQVDFITIPTAKPKQFEEYEPIICSGREDWKQRIRQEVEKLTKTDKRSVLVICETIRDVEALQTVFVSTPQENLHTYVRDYEKFSINDGIRKLQPGQIILATNLAGRGTDIQISDELRRAGGLHVVLTYLPVNIRIEEQAFGRAARCGDRGTGRLIIMGGDGKMPKLSKIFTLKQKRNTEELFRISSIKAHYDTTIHTEEHCFKRFNEVYEKKQKILSDAETPELVEEILLQNLLDNWAFWLDENNAHIISASDEATKHEVKLRLDKFLSQFNKLKAMSPNNWPSWVQGNPMQMIKLGTYISQHKKTHFSTALQLFEEVIVSEPCFCESAYYYRAYTRSRGDSMKKEDFIKDLRMAEQLFVGHISNTMLASGVVTTLKTGKPWKEGYEEQETNLLSLYSLFINSIDDILGHAISPESFVNYEFNKHLAGKIFNDLVQNGMVRKAKVIDSVNDVQLQQLHSKYGITADELKAFLKKYRGLIDEKEFLGTIRTSFTFACRKEFWATLVDQNVLHSVVKYVEVNEDQLATIDPALMNVVKQSVDRGDLIKEVVKPSKDQMLLIHEQQSVPYFVKEQLERVIGEKKYKSLEEKGLLSFNEKATIDANRITGCVFSVFDSITVKDITNNTKITNEEANTILAELLKQKVLEMRGDSFVLTDSYNRKRQILPTRSVYESVMEDLLNSRFAYRLALKSISEQLKDQNRGEICINLKPDPYLMFFNDLLDQKIIEPPMVTDEINESKLNSLYSDTWSKDKWKMVLAEDIGLSTNYIEALLDVLVKNRWIAKHSHNGDMPIRYSFTPRNNRTSVEDLKSCISSISVKHGLVESYDVGVAVEHWFNDQMILIKKGTLRHIEKVLKQSKSILKELNVPDGKLKSITEFYGEGNFINIDEIRRFITNGLEHLLQLEEKKWTKEMIRNTVTVLVMGVAQIAIGTLLRHPFISRAFISEGISDIVFALSAFKSGYFSWQNYRTHKIQSLCCTVVTTGAGMCFSQAGNIAQESVKVAFTKSVIFHTAQAVKLAASNMIVDKIVTDYLQKTLNYFAAEILVGVRAEVENHKISQSLRKAYNLLGEEKATALVNDLTETYLMERNMAQSFHPGVLQLFQWVMQGFEQASTSSTTSSGPINFKNLNRILTLVDLAGQINKMCSATRQLLDSVNYEMEQKLANIERNQTQSEENQENSKEFEHFQREVVERWKKILSEHVGELIAQHVAKPMLNKALSYVCSYMSGKFKAILRNLQNTATQNDKEREREAKLIDEFLRLKKDHESEMKKPGMDAETKHQLTEQYHDKCLKLMQKTRNPALYSAILREDVKMDMTCVAAATEMLNDMFRDHIPGLTLTVHKENGTRESFSAGQDGGPELNVMLKNEHFTLLGSESSALETTDNNCLYGIAATAFPELQAVGPDVFRLMLSDWIENSPAMREHIIQGGHRFSLEEGAVGGAERKKIHRTRQVDDESSTTNEGLNFPGDDRPPDYHLQSRIKRVFRAGGMLSRICEEDEVQFDQICDPDKGSNYKAKRPKNNPPGANLHQAHVVRCHVKPEAETLLSPSNFDTLTTAVGHTQLTDSYVNVYHKIGGRFDQLQGIVLADLSSKKVEEVKPGIIQNIKCRFVQLFNKGIKKLKKQENATAQKLEHSTYRREIDVLKTSRKYIKKASDEEFLERFRKGYEKEYKYTAKPKPPRSNGRRRNAGNEE